MFYLLTFLACTVFDAFSGWTCLLLWLLPLFHQRLSRYALRTPSAFMLPPSSLAEWPQHRKDTNSLSVRED